MSRIKKLLEIVENAAVQRYLTITLKFLAGWVEGGGEPVSKFAKQTLS